MRQPPFESAVIQSGSDRRSSLQLDPVANAATRDLEIRFAAGVKCDDVHRSVAGFATTSECRPPKPFDDLRRPFASEVERPEEAASASCSHTVSDPSRTRRAARAIVAVPEPDVRDRRGTLFDLGRRGCRQVHCRDRP
jgi:hypothetical protein